MKAKTEVFCSHTCSVLTCSPDDESPVVYIYKAHDRSCMVTLLVSPKSNLGFWREIT